MSKHKDKQRKWKLIILSAILIIAGFILISLIPTIGPYFGTFTGAIIGLNVVYGGANVATKFVTGKQIKKSPKL